MTPTPATGRESVNKRMDLVIESAILWQKRVHKYDQSGHPTSNSCRTQRLLYMAPFVLNFVWVLMLSRTIPNRSNQTSYSITRVTRRDARRPQASRSPRMPFLYILLTFPLHHLSLQSSLLSPPDLAGEYFASSTNSVIFKVCSCQALLYRSR